MIQNPNLATSSHSRLRLRGHGSQSSQDEFTQRSKESYENTENNRSDSSKEDSLTDFKSPKAEPVPRASLRAFKFEPERAKKKLLRSGSGSSKLKPKKDVTQMSLESSFFKPKHEKLETGVQCPLCFKAFKDEDSSHNHLKTCASKHNITTKQLLEAKQLQDRQVEERKAMGLLAGPVVQPKKTPVRTKKFRSNLDPELELGLAISESLYEAHKMEEIEEAVLLASKQSIFELNDEERRKTLQNFGFTTNKPQIDVPAKPRKRKLHALTTLQSRTAEEKERVLTERIADILMGEDALTQALLQESIIKPQHTEIVLRSRFLREILHKKNRLWDKSRLSKKHEEFYTAELRPHLFPEQVGEMIMTDSGLISDAQDVKDTKVESSEEEITQITENDQELNNSETPTMISDIKGEEDVNRKFVEQLVINWGDALNDSSASDVILLVKNENYIWTHKLVFHVRCSNILLDLQPNDEKRFPRIKEKLCWSETNRRAALAFLEFIYCGVIDKHLGVFDDAELLTDVRRLARKYRVRDLFSYINRKVKEVEFKSATNSKLNKEEEDEVSIIEDVKNEPNVSRNVLKDECNETNNQQSKHNTFEDKHLVQEDVQKEPQTFEDPVTKSLGIRRFTASPDLFTESEEEKDDIGGTQNLKILTDLIQEETQNEIPVEEPSVMPKTTKPSASSNKIPSQKLNESCTPKSRRTKLKSELSLFIDRIRKENAKTMTDTDTDSDSEILKYPVKRKNPFKKVKNVSSSLLVDPNKEIEKRRNGLSLLEEIIRDEAAKNPAAFNMTSYKPAEKLESITQPSKHTNDEVFVPAEASRFLRHTSSDDEPSEKEISMYSKYMRKRKKRNSIEKYRRALKLQSKSLEKEQVNDKSIETTNKTKEDITLVSDSELDFSDISSQKTSNPRKETDKSVSKSFCSENTTPSETEIPKSKNVIDLTEQEHSDNECSIPSFSSGVLMALSPDFEVMENLHSSKVTSNTSLEKAKESKSKEPAITNSQLQISQSLAEQMEDIRTEQDIQRQSSRTNCDVSAIVIHSSPEYIENNEINSEKSGKINSSIPKAVNNEILTGIEIEGSWFRHSLSDEEFSRNRRPRSESPEPISKETGFNKRTISDLTGRKRSKQISTDSIRDLDTSPVVTPKNRSPISQTSRNPENVLSKASKESSKVKKGSGLSLKKNSLQELQKQSEIASSFHDSSIICPLASSTMREERVPQILDSPKSLNFSQGRRCGSVSPETPSRNIRTLKTKSTSEANIKRNGTSQKSVITPPRRQFSHLIQNYSEMNTPELQKQLNKFGLKPQKRSKAEQLLSHINNELMQREVLQSQKSTSEDDDEPPCKKAHTSKKCATKQISQPKSQAEQLRNRDITISEELEFDDSDSAGEVANPGCIKDAFNRLLEANENLYNKMLLFESLELEMLHSMLKQRGFKCKKNELMDYLDGQCITFHVKTDKKSRVKNRT